ncbi:MAG: class I SAM-dependent methyltransferase [Nitrospirae bacterium]|nr:class I SAM-dependent methyltransferase [Nitrospirota bacterium]
MDVVRAVNNSWELFCQHAGRELFYELAGRYFFARPYVTGRVVLDAACGMGYGTVMLSGSAQRTVGIDRREHAISYCLNNHDKSVVQFAQACGPQLAFDDAVFDTVVLFESPGPISDVDGLMKDLHRVLKPGGVLLLAAANRRCVRPARRGPILQCTVEELQEMLAKYFHVSEIWGQGYLSSKDLVLLDPTGVKGLVSGPDGLCRKLLRVLLRHCAFASVRATSLLRLQIWANKLRVGDVEPSQAFYLIAKAEKGAGTSRPGPGTLLGLPGTGRS